MSFDPWGAPASAPVPGWTAQQVVPAGDPDRRRRDLITAGTITVGLVLLGAPMGLLWAAISPRYTAVLTQGQYDIPNIESDKSAVGAEGTLVFLMLGIGVLCGVLAWRFARRSGPYTVGALVVGGLLAGTIAGHVGLIPGQQHAFQALKAGKGDVQLWLGKRGVDKKGNPTNDVSLRAPWAAAGWPVGALIAFAIPAFIRPEELD